MRDFSTIATPLNELTKKDVPFVWGTAQEEAFTVLKDKLTHAPLLQLPDFNKTFELECDASGIGLGGVISQDGKPAAYFSEKLSGPSLNFSTYDKELWDNCIFTPSWFLPMGFALSFRTCSVLPLLFPSRSLECPLTV